MKKTFQLNPTNIKVERHLEAIKNEIRKYIKRERKKQLPDHVDFWDFDCLIGDSTETVESIHVSKINKAIDKLKASGAESFYMEILAKPGKRMKTILEDVE